MDYGDENTLWLTLGVFDDPTPLIQGAPRDANIFRDSAAPWLARLTALPHYDFFGSYRNDAAGPCGGTPWQDSAEFDEFYGAKKSR